MPTGDLLFQGERYVYTMTQLTIKHVFLFKCFVFSICSCQCNAAIEEWQGEHAWGRVLDAGTGLHSLRWISSLDSEAWTAVTAETSILSEIGAGVQPREADEVASG